MFRIHHETKSITTELVETPPPPPPKSDICHAISSLLWTWSCNPKDNKDGKYDKCVRAGESKFLGQMTTVACRLIIKKLDSEQ